MKSSTSKQSQPTYSSQIFSDKKPSDFWKAVRTNIKLQHQAPPIKPIPRSKSIPLSFAQERLWLLDQLQPGSSIHNMRAAFRLKGSLNVAVLEKSLGEIVRRHEILRTTFLSVDGQPVQDISPDIDLKLPVVDLRELSETEQEAEVQRLATEEAEQSFDLTDEPLLRVKLLRLTEDEHILLRTVHHTIFDGWSHSVFMRELAVLYEAFSSGKPSPLPELPIQYADFAVSQRSWLQGEAVESLLDYWTQQLSGNIPSLELPIDHPRPTIPTYQGASQSFVLSKNLTTALKKLSEQEGVSLFVTLLTAFQTLLHRYTGQEDIILCSPVAGRNRSEIKRLIGYFSNLVVIRTDLSGNPNFRELMSRVSQVTLGAYEHQNLPFQKLADFPNLIRTPLNRGMFALQNTPPQPLKLADVTVTPLDVTSEASNFDLYLSMKEKGEKLSGVLYYKTDLFEVATITQLLKHFEALLDSFVTNPEQHIEDLPFYKPTEPLQPSNQTAENLGQESTHTFVAPRDELELQLTQIWEKVFGIHPISINDNFFDLGGHSLLAVRLFAQIEKTFGKTLPLATLFQAATVEQLANILHPSVQPTPLDSLTLIKSGSSKLPLLLVYDGDGRTLFYANLARHLDSEQVVYAIQPSYQNGSVILPNRMTDIVADCIEKIRTVQPEGPYLLGGMCIGGRIAFEVACQLQSQGQTVALVALFDSLEIQKQRLVRRLSNRHINRKRWHRFLQVFTQNKRQLSHEKQLNHIINAALKKIKNVIVYEFRSQINRIGEKFHMRFYGYYVNKGLPLPKYFKNIPTRKLLGHIQEKHEFNIYRGRVILFKAREGQFGKLIDDPELGWGKRSTDGVEVYDIPGIHSSIFQEPQVQVLAEKLQSCIDRAIADSVAEKSTQRQQADVSFEYQSGLTSDQPPPRNRTSQ